MVPPRASTRSEIPTIPTPVEGADRIGRRRVMVAVGFLAPLVASLGAIAPNFASLVGTQAIGDIARGVTLELHIVTVGELSASFGILDQVAGNFGIIPSIHQNTGGICNAATATR